MTLPGQSNRLPRGVCPECQRDVALRVGGELREHVDRGGEKCWTAGFTIIGAEAEIEKSLAEFRRALHG